jgi:hypothetical protein
MIKRGSSRKINASKGERPSSSSGASLVLTREKEK